MLLSRQSPARTWAAFVNPDSGLAILDSEMEKLTALDFQEKVKVSEALAAPRGGTTRFSALWQADRTRIQRMAPIEYIGRYMRGWFDFAIADELHQLAGDTAQGNGLGVLGRAAQRLIALTGTLMGGYADDLFNIFYRMEPRAMVREGFAYGGQGRRDFQEQYGVLETIEKVEESDNACSRATKKTVRVLRKPGASPLLFGRFLMNTTAFLSLEDISDKLPRYDESVISVDMDEALQQAYEKLEEDIRSAMKAHRGNKSLMSILLNTLLLYPDHPYDFDEIWARARDPQTKEYVKFLVTEPENLTREALYAKERALIADVKEELRQGRRCQVYATYTGEKDVTLRLRDCAAAGRHPCRYPSLVRPHGQARGLVRPAIEGWRRACRSATPSSLKRASIYWRFRRSTSTRPVTPYTLCARRAEDRGASGRGFRCELSSLLTPAQCRRPACVSWARKCLWP